MKVVILVLALLAVAYATPGNDEQDAEVEDFLNQLKLAQDQGVNAEDFLSKLMEEDEASEQDDNKDELASEQEEDEDEVVSEKAVEEDDDSSEQDDEEDKVTSEEAAEQDDDEEDEAKVQAAFLANLQNEDEETIAALQELARDQSPKAKAQWIPVVLKLGKLAYKGYKAYKAIRRIRRRRRRRRRGRWWGWISSGHFAINQQNVEFWSCSWLFECSNNLYPL